MNNQFTQATLLFQTAEQKILGYAKKIEYLQELIKQRLEKGTPLPEGARASLQFPDDEAFLADALVEWNKGKEATLAVTSGMRGYLSQYNIGMAIYTVANWSNSITRPMERILNYTYQTSDILPPPHLYLDDIENEFRELFPLNESESLNSPQEDAFIRYLKAAGNPWEKYATK